MRVVMDSDCLIKLVQARAKELVCRTCTVVIPPEVRREVVDDGQGRPDALATGQNIATGLLAVAASRAESGDRKGEDAVLALYRQGGFDGVCSDDRRLLGKLRTLGIPYLTPATLIVVLVRKGCLSRDDGAKTLIGLAPRISVDEYAVARLSLARSGEAIDQR